MDGPPVSLTTWSHCPGPRCKAQTPPGHAMCQGCWEKVPREIQERVAEAWCPDFATNKLRHAVTDAVRFLIHSDRHK